MNSYKYDVERSARFNREVRKAERRGLNIDELNAVIDLLRRDIKLDPQYKDHQLHGKGRGLRECHINPDWLLVYLKDKEELILHLVHTGTHSDLFG